MLTAPSAPHSPHATAPLRNLHLKPFGERKDGVYGGGVIFLLYLELENCHAVGQGEADHLGAAVLERLHHI